MNYEAVRTNFKELTYPAPLIAIIFIWLLTSYFLYTHKAQKPETKKIADSKVTQKNHSPMTPTPKVGTAQVYALSKAITPTPPQTIVTGSVVSQNSSSNNNGENSDTNNTPVILPTQIPTISELPGDSSPTIIPQPTSPKTEVTATPIPTGGQPSNSNSAPAADNLATTVDSLTQVLPPDLNLLK